MLIPFVVKLLNGFEAFCRGSALGGRDEGPPPYPWAVQHSAQFSPRRAAHVPTRGDVAERCGRPAARWSLRIRRWVANPLSPSAWETLM